MQQPLTPEPPKPRPKELLIHLRFADSRRTARLGPSVGQRKEDHEIFGETEFQARDIVHCIGRESLGDAPRSKTTATKAPGVVPVPVRCEQTAKFHGCTGRKAAFSLMGPVPCVQRLISQCGKRYAWRLPWTIRVGLTGRAFTPAAEKIVTLAGE